MRVAILGAGAIAFGTAAALCSRGHAAVLWSPSGRRTAGLGAGLRASGAVEGVFAPAVAHGCAAAVEGADAVLVAVPGYGHRVVLEAVAPHLRAGQVVIYSSHMSFGALYLRQLLGGRAVPIVALGTTVATGRQTGMDSVLVNTVRARLDAAVVGGAPDGPLALCRALFGDRFVDRGSLLAIALSNLNPQNHLAIALCNLTRMEKGEAWSQNGNITPAVAALIEALDAERLAIAAAFGLSVRTIREHFHLSFDVPLGPLAAQAAILAARPADTRGPATLDSRYVTEDVPFGLVPTVRLAALAGVPAPLHAAGGGDVRRAVRAGFRGGERHPAGAGIVDGGGVARRIRDSGFL